MQPNESNLPPRWEYSMDTDQYNWVNPEYEYDDTPDIRISKSRLDWYISYWVRNEREWVHIPIPPSPEPPFELAEALYYAAQ